MHHVVVFEGGKPITKEEAQKEAIELARRSGHDAAKLNSLVVEHLPAMGAQFRVDVKKKKLIALDAPPRPARGAASKPPKVR